jgi:hypothetical protein
MTNARAGRRRFVRARHGETVAQVVEREFPDDRIAPQRLLSWNLHLALRRSPSGAPGQLLGTDIVYIEPPDSPGWLVHEPTNDESGWLMNPDEPTIVAAQIAAGHDGQAEVSVHVQYANGAVRDISFPHEAIGPVLDATGITSLDQLVGRPWTILLGAT